MLSNPPAAPTSLKKIMGLSVVLLCICITTRAVNGQESNCPKYEEGDFWIFDAIESNDESSKSTRLNGLYKVTYEAGQFIVQDFPYESRLTRILFPCVSEGNYFLKLPLSTNKTWYVKSKRRSTRSGNDYNYEANYKVIDLKQIKLNEKDYPIYYIEGHEYQFNRDRAEFVFNYSFIPELKTIVNYSDKDVKRPVSNKIFLVAIGSTKNPGGIQFINVDREIDSGLNQKILQLYPPKTPTGK